jgi:NADH dehydrogenase
MSITAIVGGGFAGTAAARTLCRKKTDVHLFDPNPTFDFLPYLPDVLGRRLSPDSVCQSHAGVARRYGFTYHEQEVSSVDLRTHRIATADGSSFEYDYLIWGTGAETNFYGDEQARQRSFRMRSLGDVLEILDLLQREAPQRFVVVGGGYTGLEAASQLRRYCLKTGTPMEIVIVELEGTILPMRAQWMRRYMREQLEKLDISIKTGCTVEKFEDGGVRLTTGERISNCRVIWNAGVKVTHPFTEGAVQTDKRGQVVVDRYLRAGERCYVVGDSSRVEKGGEPLPMASYLSVQQGSAAARNVLREIRGRPQKPYRPRDYGLVIALANGRGCGTLLGFRVRGIAAGLIHHVASYYRTRDCETRRSILRDLFRQGTGL